ncbi:MAG: sodium:proton symporter [Hyphomicrobiales bacterium]|nr:MAG: sodium:proton symporter [Hyphomicrobiales bacterium]
MPHSLSLIACPLAWLGRQGTLAVAVSAVLGICLPPLSALARPFLQEAVFALLVLAFLRVDITAIRGHLARPVLLVAIVVWMMVVVPVGLGIFGRASGLIHAAPEMMLALYIVAVTPPLMSGPAFAYLLGLDGALSLAILVLGMVLTPISAPLLAPLVLGSALPISAFALSLRLAGLLLGSVAVAYVLRRLLGNERVNAAREEINGLNVVLLFVFAVAVMDGVAANFAENPYLSTAVAILTVLIALGQIAVTMLVFIAQGGARAFVIALSAGNRNMSLIVAALGAAVPDFTWLYFALAQLPIYFLPLLVKPIATRLTRNG